MPRYLVLEVEEGQGKLADFMDDMRALGKVKLMAEGLDTYPMALYVKIPARPLVKVVGTVKGTTTTIYVTEER